MERERKPLIWWLLVAAAAILAVALVAQLVSPGSDGPLGSDRPADSERPAGSAPSTPSSTSSSAVPPTVSSSPQVEVACAEHPPIPNPAAPAYQGRGPHLIIPGSPQRPLGGRLHVIGIDQGHLPRAWLPANRTEFTHHWWNSSMAPLIFCPTAVRQSGTKPVGTCEWIGHKSTKVYPATWTFAVYETKTGREVATFSLPSDSSKGRTCPASMQAPPLDIAQPPSTSALQAAVRPLVTRSVP
jgi:hypothetical protein